MASRKRNYDYLLGDSRTEAQRLQAQARLWDPTAHALFDRLAVGKGWRVLEIGPGRGSLHMELRRRVGGPIDAVERSATFCEHLESTTRRDKLGPGNIQQSDLLDAELPRNEYDLIFARWVFLFLPDPLAHVRKLVRALKPGGLLAIEDYLRDTLTMAPLPDEWPHFMAADHAFFATQGGDANIGGRLPRLYEKAGLDLIEVTPTVKSGNPGTAVWNWLSTYFLSYMERYGELPPFTLDEARRLKKQWIEAGKKKTSLLVAPAVLDVVGRKPR